MNPCPAQLALGKLSLLVMAIGLVWWPAPQSSSVLLAQETPASLETQRALRKEFQSLELTTSRYGGWIFPLGVPPKIVWRDAEAAKKFGCDPGFNIQWFNSEY